MYEKYEEKFNVIYPDSKNATYSSILNYSNDLNKPFQRWYRYKEGFSIDLVKKLIKEYKVTDGIILDPFAGSGSTLLGANELGLKSIGFEVNPFSYFLATTKLRNYDKQTITEFKKAYEILLKESFVHEEEASLPALSISSRVFDDEIRRYYMKVKKGIINYKTKDKHLKDLLKLGWLACLEEVSNYRKAGNGLKKRKYVKPRNLTVEDVRSILFEQYNKMYNDIQLNNLKFEAELYNETCMNMNKKIKNDSISGIIFSPPYPNCFDYTEIYKLELWFGDFVKEYGDLKRLRDISLRSHLNGNLSTEYVEINENELLNKVIKEIETKELWSKKIPDMLVLYFYDMFNVLDICYRILNDGGFCSIVVSNSAYGGVVVPTDLILTQYAENIGFLVDKIEIDRYMITSSQQYEIIRENKRYLRESLICLKKKT